MREDKKVLILKSINYRTKFWNKLADELFDFIITVARTNKYLATL